MCFYRRLSSDSLLLRYNFILHKHSHSRWWLRKHFDKYSTEDSFVANVHLKMTVQSPLNQLNQVKTFKTIDFYMIYVCQK